MLPAGKPKASRTTGGGATNGARPAGADSGRGASGRPGLRAIRPEQIGELQRARILGAMTQLVRELGVSNVTVAHVVERSGVSRRTFYELFEDRETCFLAAFDVALARAAEHVVPVYEAGGPSWLEQMRAGLSALLEWLDEEPQAGAMCVVDTFAGGAAVLERRRRVVETLIDAVQEGRREAEAGLKPGRLAAEGVVGAVLSVLHGRLSTSEREPLSKLLNPLMAMVALPYLGPAAADRELTRRAPRKRPPTKQAPAQGNPLRGLHMRLTYRTVRVLLAIADLGERGHSPSSREVADASGVSDAGQMSKLLSRLESLGLIANEASPAGRGEPNEWTLTDHGRQVEQTIRAQSA